MKKSFLSDYFLTLITQVIVSAINVIVIKVMSVYLLKESFAVFLIGKRYLAFILPVVTLNLNLSLARYISSKPQNSSSYFSITLSLITGLNLVVCILFIFFHEIISRLMFGDESFSIIFVGIQLFLLATSSHILLTGFLRGKKLFKEMNILEILFWFCQLLAAIVFVISDIGSIHILLYYFILSTVLIFIAQFLYLFNIKSMRDIFADVLSKFKAIKLLAQFNDFVKYGYSRLFQSVFFMSIFLVPLVITSNNLDLEEAAFIGIIISVLNLIQIFIYPFNLMFLPIFSDLQAKKQEHLTNKYSQIVLDYVFSFSLLFGPLLYLFSYEIIFLWFGQSYIGAVNYLMYTSPIITFLIAYFLIKGILDGLYDYPYVNWITFFGLTGILLLSYLLLQFDLGILAIIFAFEFGIIVIGILSIFLLVNKQNLRIISMKNFISLIWAVLIFILCIWINNQIGGMSLFQSLLIKIFLGTFILILSLLLYKKLKYGWIQEVTIRIRNLIHSNV